MKQITPWCLTVLLLPICLLCSCSPTKPVAVERAPTYLPTPESTPVRIAAAPAPRLAEVQDAIRRIFKDAAVIEESYTPTFLAGDFNGDESQDIAVIVKPAKLDEMNEQYQPWLLRDLRADISKRPALKIEKDEVLLAVIHGYGANDWRDPEATQTFLLKNAVGDGLKVHSGKEFVTANSGRKLPLPQGDLIGETLRGTPGYLYYYAANYSWYDPKTFKGESAARTIHQPRVMRAHAQKAPDVVFITVEELKTKLNANEAVTIIDVRSSEGYAASSSTIKTAIHFKLRKLKGRVLQPPLKDLPKDREIVTYCACPKDQSSIAAAQILQETGFKRVKVLQGGWQEWLRASGPVEPRARN